MTDELQKAIKLLMAHADEDFVSKNDALEAAASLHNATVNFDRWDLIIDIIKEIARAESKHPNWPADYVYGMSIVGEEYGEAMREAVKIEMNEPGASEDNLRMELIHTAGTCLRMLKNL